MWRHNVHVFEWLGNGSLPFCHVIAVESVKGTALLKSKAGITFGNWDSTMVKLNVNLESAMICGFDGYLFYCYIFIGDCSWLAWYIKMKQ